MFRPLNAHILSATIERSHSLVRVPLLAIFETKNIHKHDLAQRAVVNLISNVDAMIQKFEDTFQDLKIQLILGSSLQTAIVSFRILQKVENIGKAYEAYRNLLINSFCRNYDVY